VHILGLGSDGQVLKFVRGFLQSFSLKRPSGRDTTYVIQNLDK
jgi:hypothetical protein